MSDTASDEQRRLMKHADKLDYMDMESSTHPKLRFGVRRKRTFAVLLGAACALLILTTHSLASGASSSPRAIVQQGWRHAHDIASTSFTKDYFHDYIQRENCSVRSPDLYQAANPLCRDRQKLLEAMGGGGRIGWDKPYQTLDCDMQWFSGEEICNILNRFDNIYIVGDSMLRHLAQALHVHVRGNLIDGGRATWKTEGNAATCTCATAFDNPGCIWAAALNTDDILKGDPTSIRCSANKPPANIVYHASLSYPLSDDALAWIGDVKNKDNPNGRDVLIANSAVWNDYEPESSMAWLEQLEGAMSREMPEFFSENLAPSLFPRLFITSNAQGEGKPNIFHGVQNNIRVMRHEREMSMYANRRGYDHLGFYNLTVQTTSNDGTHANWGGNLMKGMMVLNWLNMLDPPVAAEQRPDIPSTTGKVVDRPLHSDVFKEAAPTDLTALPTPTAMTTSGSRPTGPPGATHSGPANVVAAATSQHPIDELRGKAERDLKVLLSKRTKTLEDTAAVYRQRRGRHPPPQFDKWYAFAEEHNVVMVEDFWDTLYDDLKPFWSMPPANLRKFPAAWPYTLKIRNGTIERWVDEPANIAPWLELWKTGFEMLPVADLPDIDLAFNGEDEPKIFTPWEVRHAHAVAGEKTKHTRIPTLQKPIHNNFATYPSLGSMRPQMDHEEAYQWSDLDTTTPLWVAARDTCDPKSPGRSAPALEDYSTPARWPNASTQTYMHKGYVSDWGMAKSVCANPEIRNYHQSFIGMIHTNHEEIPADKLSVIRNLVPLLSGCRMHDVNSEILLPPAMQWSSPEQKGDNSFVFSEKKRVPWENKTDTVFWRGSASGGTNSESDWTRSHRHRLLSMTNGTLAAQQQSRASEPVPKHVPGGSPRLPYNFPLPDLSVYPLAVLTGPNGPNLGKYAAWINSVTDTAFVHLRCWPPVSWFVGNGADCPYNSAFYEVKAPVSSTEQFAYKYHPDLDGASYSGRYRSILQSNSLPLKATIYDEWHDARLVPWAHFVPMDVSNVDWWGIFEYFFGFEDQRPGHDEVARSIAADGSEWSRTVLRDEDMLAYTYRLILELARLNDERRENMGWTDDLV